MRTFHKVIALLSVFTVAFSLFGCSGKTTAVKVNGVTDYENWFINGFEAAYEKCVKSGKVENMPSSDLSLLIASDEYVRSVFAYIKNGTKPVSGEITEKDGVYTYKYEKFDQVIEFSSEKTAMKIVMHQHVNSETYVDFIANFVQEGNYYYLQFLAPDFTDYAEAKFTEKSGRAMRRGDLNTLPYDIFSEDIPTGFGKEKQA